MPDASACCRAEAQPGWSATCVDAVVCVCVLTKMHGVECIQHQHTGIDQAFALCIAQNVALYNCIVHALVKGAQAVIEAGQPILANCTPPPPIIQPLEQLF